MQQHLDTPHIVTSGHLEPEKEAERMIEVIAQPTSPNPSPLKGRRGNRFHGAASSDLPLRPIGDDGEGRAR